jgi:hypothetical protein
MNIDAIMTESIVESPFHFRRWWYLCFLKDMHCYLIKPILICCLWNNFISPEPHSASCCQGCCISGMDWLCSASHERFVCPFYCLGLIFDRISFTDHYQTYYKFHQQQQSLWPHFQHVYNIYSSITPERHKANP